MPRDSAKAPGPPSRKPSLLFVNQFYHPDVAATGQHLKDLAEFLSARGYAVTVFTASGRYGSRDVRALESSEELHDVNVRRLRGTKFGRETAIGRIVDYLGFYLQVFARLMFGLQYDGVVFLTTPPLLSVIGWFARSVRRQRYGIWSMDLHPAAEIAAGMFAPGSLQARFLMSLWRSSHRRADFVIALGDFMKERIVAEGIKATNVVVVPPWSAKSSGEGLSDSTNRIRDRLNLGDRFVVMYSGNAGLVHDFDAFLAAMRLLSENADIFFLFVGDGPRRREIEAFARRERLRNFAYENYFARDELPHALAAGDVHLLSLRREFAGISVPSKLYGIMAAARPALFVGPTASEPASTISEADCGTVIDVRDVPEAAMLVRDTLLAWRTNPRERARLGANGRRALEVAHETEANCARIARSIDEHWGTVDPR